MKTALVEAFFETACRAGFLKRCFTPCLITIRALPVRRRDSPAATVACACDWRRLARFDALEVDHSNHQGIKGCHRNPRPTFSGRGITEVPRWRIFQIRAGLVKVSPP